jgi:galactokinase
MNGTSQRQAAAFAPGRVNLIGEHTDYNQGLALPFAIAQGITVHAHAIELADAAGARVYAHAVDLSEHDEFPLDDPPPSTGWRAFVRGIVAELQHAGFVLPSTQLQLGGDLPRGAGLSSSAALEVSLCLALLGLIDAASTEHVDLARLCSRVESEWAGAHTGLLDQLASLCGAPDTALRIDFMTLQTQHVPMRLQSGWRLVTVDSGERHVNASSAYNERRAECGRACELLDVESLRQASASDVERLPEPLRRRARHVLAENARVQETVAALCREDLSAVARLLNASHASLRDQYEVSTDAVEATVRALLEAGAGGARMIGGGFGGHVLGLLPPGVEIPEGAREVRASAGAHLLDH